jgi:hypothetical protein
MFEGRVKNAEWEQVRERAKLKVNPNVQTLYPPVTYPSNTTLYYFVVYSRQQETTRSHYLKELNLRNEVSEQLARAQEEVTRLSSDLET